MQKKFLVLLVFLVIAILIFFNQNFPPIKFLAGTVQSIFSSPKAVMFDARAGAADETEEVKKIKGENARITKKLIDYEKIKGDNTALRSQFENGSTLKYEMLPASIIGFTGKFSSPLDLIVDKGESSDVVKGQAVILGDNLVGTITLVSENYSKVTLPTNTSFSALVKTSENGSLGVVTGQDDFILLDRVPINEKIINGETVVTKGEINSEGNGIPPDLIIGKIKAVSRKESAPFQNAKVVSSLNFSKLTKVFIIQKIK